MPSNSLTGTSVFCQIRSESVQLICLIANGLRVSREDPEIYDSWRQDLIQYAAAVVGAESASDLLRRNGRSVGQATASDLAGSEAVSIRVCSQRGSKSAPS